MAEVVALRDDALTLRSPPHNFDAEVQLLGAILANNRAIEKVEDFLKGEHFADSRHGRIYDACQKLIRLGQIASAVTLKNYFEQDSTLAEIGGAAYLGRLAAAAVTIINAGDHGKIVYDLYLRRKLIELGHEVVNRAYAHDLETSAAEQIGEAEAALLGLAESGDLNARIIGVGPAAASALQTANETGQRDNALAGLTTGFDELDRMTGGLEPDSVYVLAARPSMGKTSLALWMAWAAAEQRKPVGFFSLEMSAKQLGRRLLAGLCDIDLGRIKAGRLDANDWKRLTEAETRLRDVPLMIDDATGVSAAQIRSRARRMKQRKGLGLIVIDHLTIMGKDPGLHSRANTVEIVGRNSTLIKQMAKELHVPVLLLCQLSRANEQRDDKRPQLSDLRWAGEIEQDADLVMFVHREHYYLERSKPSRKTGETGEAYANRYEAWETRCRETENMADLSIAKQRDGAVGTINLQFTAPTARFRNLERQP